MSNNILNIEQFIHSIIDSVDHSPYYGDNQQTSNGAKYRRARRLAAESARIIRLLQDELIPSEWAEYERLYDTFRGAKGQWHSPPDDALYAAEELWDFAIRTAREVDWRSTQSKRPQRPQVTMAQPTSWLLTPVTAAPMALPSLTPAPAPAPPAIGFRPPPPGPFATGWTATPIAPPVAALPWQPKTPMVFSAPVISATTGWAPCAFWSPPVPYWCERSPGLGIGSARAATSRKMIGSRFDGIWVVQTQNSIG